MASGFFNQTKKYHDTERTTSTQKNKKIIIYMYRYNLGSRRKEHGVHIELREG